MKQIFALILAVLFVFCVAGAAMATVVNPGPGYYQFVDPGNPNDGKIKYFPNGQPENNSQWHFLGNGGSGPGITIMRGKAVLDQDTFAIYGAFDASHSFFGLNGFTGAGAIAGGSNDVKGGTLFGKIGIEGQSISGAWAESNSKIVPIFDIDWCDHTLTLGLKTINTSSAEALQINSISGKALGLTMFYGDFEAFAAESTFATGSAANNWFNFSDGFTFGMASQEATAGAEGCILGGLFGDATVGVYIDLIGTSSIEAGKYTTFGPGYVTEGLYATGGSATNVSFIPNAKDCGLAIANVNGGWQASGGVVLGAVQSAPGATATSCAIGSYSGAGTGAGTFAGSAVGIAGTSITQYANGVVSQSYGSMNVSVTR
jgi:hypothetical protein